MTVRYASLDCTSAGCIKQVNAADCELLTPLPVLSSGPSRLLLALEEQFMLACTNRSLLRESVCRSGAGEGGQGLQPAHQQRQLD